MKSHPELLDQLRAALGTRPAPVGAAALTQLAGSLGAPPHLAPGTRVVDPITGQEGEILAYGRAHQIVAPA
jgi:hypothetical protein